MIGLNAPISEITITHPELANLYSIVCSSNPTKIASQSRTHRASIVQAGLVSGAPVQNWDT
jgi:hypothetical protein